MAVIKNHFETTLSDSTLSMHTITGLTAEDSRTSVPKYCHEGTLYFLKSVYKSLTDAGYTDTVINEEDFSITVLGFKLFILTTNYNSSSLMTYPSVYVYGTDKTFSYKASLSTGYSNYTINNCITYGKTLSYNIIVRGDENCVQIAYSSFSYPNSEVPLIFIAKAKNLITEKEAFCCCSDFTDNNNYSPIYFKEKNDLYTCTFGDANSSNTYKNYFQTFYLSLGNNTNSKFVCEPILGNYGTFLTYSLLKCNSVNFERGKYYKIGNDLYFCYGYKLGTATSYDGSYLLFKVS